MVKKLNTNFERIGSLKSCTIFSSIIIHWSALGCNKDLELQNLTDRKMIADVKLQCAPSTSAYKFIVATMQGESIPVLSQQKDWVGGVRNYLHIN